MKEKTEAQAIADAITKKGAGKTAGIIACVLAICGILFIGILFIPLAIIVALVGTFVAIKNKNPSGMAVCLLAWVLITVGFFTSPFLIGAIGLAARV